MKKFIYPLLIIISIITFQSCDDDDPLPVPLTHTIGDFYQGGVIFYLDATGEHGLISAVSDQSFDAVWGCPPLIVNGANGEEIGTGAQNTTDIVNGCSSTISGFAAELCENLELNEFNDWFLPSKDELNELYQNRDIVNTTSIENGGAQLEDAEYWSSSHQNNNSVFVQHFTAGNQFGVSEDELYNVRAVRAF